MTRFQLFFTGIVIALGVIGAILFATVKGTGGGQQVVPVVMWGTMKADIMNRFLGTISNAVSDTMSVSYVEKKPESFESELIAALARGTGPDLVLLPQDLIVKQLDKFYTIPFANYSERTFKDTFIQEGNLYLTPEGIIGFPFSVDPLVMYWNRDMLTNEGIVAPPVSWLQFFDLASKLTKKDANGTITQSFVSFGEMRNVAHAKDIVSLLALQAGTPIVGRTPQGVFESLLNKKGDTIAPAEQAVSFFTEFSNPVKAAYSWNRAMPQNKNAFIAEKLALYFGYASELPSLLSANPNLNFDVALVPQAGGKKMTFGAMNGLAILKSSKNIVPAYTAILTLIGADVQAVWVDSSGFAPVRLDMLSSLPGDAYKSIFYQSALIATAWLDPNREATDGLFTRLIENVTSGKMRLSDSVSSASIELGTLLQSRI